MAFTLQRVLISDNVSPKCAEYLQSNGIAVDTKTKLTKEQLIAEIPNYDGLIVRSATKVTAEVIEAGSNLKIIGRAGTGVDNIDIPAASKKGIVVMNTPGGNTLSAVEHTCAMISCLARHIPQAHRSLKEGRWDRKVYMGTELAGKTLAIIGLGRIGREVAKRMQSYDMMTIGFDPLVSAEESAEFGVEWLPVEQIWPRADYITVHTPLIPQTKGLIGEKSFPVCKKGVRVVNVARGGIIDEDALVQALESGQCGGAALDVFVEEPPTNAALIQNPHVICTPHLGASTTEAQTRVAVEIAEQFVDAVQGKSLFGAINARALSNALKPETRPVVALGEAMGILASGLSSQPHQEVNVTACGPDMKGAGSYVGDAVTSGILKSRATSPLNLVNASLYAKELGVQVNTVYEEGSRNLLKVSAGSVSLVGQVQGSHPVLLEINGQSFGAGVGLVGSLVFFVSSEPLKHLAELAGGLQNNQVIAFAASTAYGERWNAAKLTQPASDLGGFEKKICSFFTTF